MRSEIVVGMVVALLVALLLPALLDLFGFPFEILFGQ
jgi:hypothetical protein